MASPAPLIILSKTGMLSPSGVCRAFDSEADGMVLGEAIGAIVLKQLDSAIADRDHIYGIIVGSDINQDGKSGGITAPSAMAQTTLETEVYDKYGLPSVTNYCTHPLVTKNKPYAFRICFIDTFQGAVLARFAVYELAARTAVVLVDTSLDFPDNQVMHN